MSSDFDYEEMSEDELWARLPFATGLEKYFVMRQLIHFMFQKNEYRRALTIAQEAADYANTSGFMREHAHMMSLCGYINYTLDNYEDSIADYKVASEIMRSLGVDSELADTEGSLGESYRETRDYTNAFDHYQVAHRLYASIDDFLGAARSALDCFNTQLRLGDLFEARNWAEIQMEYAKKSNDSHAIYHAYRSHARLGLFLEDGELTLKNATMAMRIGETCSCKYCIPASHFLLGQAYTLMNDPKTAIAHLEIAHEKYHEMNNMRMQAYCEFEFGRAAKQMHNPRKAESHFNKALQFCEIIDDPLFTFKTNSMFGDLHREHANYEESLEHFSVAYELAKDNPYLTSVKHLMLAGYFESLEMTMQSQTILNILKDIEQETQPWMLPTYIRMTYSARAHMLLGNKEQALHDADEVLSYDCEVDDLYIASLHQTRAEAYRNVDPRLALSEAHKAISYFLHSGDIERAGYLADKWVIEPDKQTRAQVIAEQSRNKYDEIYHDEDPIVQQLKDERTLLSNPDTTAHNEDTA